MQFKTKPFDKQLAAFKALENRRWFALFMEMGTGKSKVIIDDASRLYEEEHINAVLVLCPNGVQQNWVLKEIPQHCPVPHACAYYRSGWSKSERLAWAAMEDPHFQALRFYCFNIDSLNVKKAYAEMQRILRKYKTLLVIDESHRIKTPGANRTKAAQRLAPLAIGRRICTGTPMPNGPIDIYSQMRFLSHDCLGHRTAASFKAAHVLQETVKLDKHRSFQKIVGYRDLDKLKANIAQHSFSCKLKDVVELPPLINRFVYTQFTPEQRRIYKELMANAAAVVKGAPPDSSPAEKILWALENPTVTPKNVLTKILRLQQVGGGHVVDDDGKTHQIASTRYKTLLSILEDCGSPAIIWAQFRAELNTIAEFLEANNISYVRYDGTTKPAECTRAIKAFQNGEVEVFLGQPKSGGIGITLTAARHVIWFSMGYNYDDYAQATARAHRIGQKHPVNVHHLIAQGSLDKKIYTLLQSKAETQEQMIYE